MCASLYRKFLAATVKLPNFCSVNTKIVNELSVNSTYNLSAKGKSTKSAKWKKKLSVTNQRLIFIVYRKRESSTQKFVVLQHSNLIWLKKSTVTCRILMLYAAWTNTNVTKWSLCYIISSVFLVDILCTQYSGKRTRWITDQNPRVNFVVFKHSTAGNKPTWQTRLTWISAN